MKRLTYILSALIGVVMLASCKKEEPQLTSIVPCVIEQIPAEVFDVNAIMKERKNLFTLKWQPAQFKTEDGEVKVAPVIYNIEFDAYGNGFNDAKAYSIIQGDANSFDIPALDFSSWLLSNIKGIKANAETKVEVRIKAQFGDGDNFAYSSNAQTINIIPFGVQPMFIIGDFNEWNTSDATYRMFRNSNKQDDFELTYTGKFKSEFKIIAKGALGTEEMYYKASDGTMAFGVHEGDPFTVASEGFYTMTINVMTMTYKLEPYNAASAKTYTAVGLMGQWCDWSTSAAKAQLTKSAYNPHLWYGTFNLETVEYGVKFCGNKGWGDKWSPTTKTTEEIPFGISIHNYVDPDDPAADPNFALGSAVGTYFVSLNDLTGHYIIEKQN